MSEIQKGEYVDLAVSAITVVEDSNPRQEFEEATLFGLAESMRSTTQLQPIIVNLDEDGKYVLIAGERRLRAAKNNGDEMIEAKVYQNLSPLDAMKMTRDENRQRVKLNAIENARVFAKLHELGMSLEQIAEDEKCSVQTVRNYLNLLKLPVEVQAIVSRDKNPLPVHQALLIGRVKNEETQGELAQKAAPESGPVASEDQVRQWVSDIVDGPKLLETSEISDQKSGEQASGKAEVPIMERVCRECGCTHENPCHDDDGEPCHWIEPDLCSECRTDYSQLNVIPPDQIDAFKVYCEENSIDIEKMSDAGQSKIRFAFLYPPLGAKLPDADPEAEARAKREEQKKKDKPVLKPVKGTIGIVGAIEICSSTLAYVKKALITVNIGGEVAVLNADNFQLDFSEESEQLKTITKLIKNSPENKVVKKPQSKKKK